MRHLNDSPPTLPSALSLRDAADLQDNLLTVANDLDRLQNLLADACDGLLSGFVTAARELGSLQPEPGPVADAIGRSKAMLGQAVVSLQFQDMATQLIEHTRQRLRHCTDRIARDALADDEDEDDELAPVTAAPNRPNPVTQDEMDAGSIELF